MAFNVVGVRFKQAGKIYYFDPAGNEVKVGDNVIVETARGIEFGQVMVGNKEVTEDKVTLPLKMLSGSLLLKTIYSWKRIRRKRRKRLGSVRRRLMIISWI